MHYTARKVAFNGPHLWLGSQVTKAVFAIPLTQVTGGQRPSLTLVKDSTPLTLVEGGTKVLPNLTLTGSKILHFWLQSKLLLTLTCIKDCQLSISKAILKVLFTFDHYVKDTCSCPSLSHLWRESMMRQSQLFMQWYMYIQVECICDLWPDCQEC